MHDDETLALVAALPEDAWRISYASPGEAPLQFAQLPDGRIALRGGANADLLVYTRGEFRAFLLGAKDGEFDDLV